MFFSRPWFRSIFIVPAFMTPLVLVSASNVLGQTPDGALAGTIHDASGARVVGAQVSATATASGLSKNTISDASGEFRLEALQPGEYQLEVTAPRFAPARSAITITVGSVSRVAIVLKPEAAPQTVQVEAGAESVTSQNIDTTSSIEQTVIAAKDLVSLPLASRSFANIAYLSPMTQPVEPSDPTKARITAVSFGGSSGLNVDLSVDGGDNNDDFIGGFLQNYSPEAMQEFVVRTSQFGADTSRTNGGSVIISTRRGTDEWHGGVSYYYRGQALNARNPLDNPEPDPKQPFSRQNGVGTFGGPLRRDKLWFFTSYEYIDENASVAYSANSQSEFNALAQLAAAGLIPGINSIAVPTNVPVPFRDNLFDVRLDWSQSTNAQWFLRASLDRNRTQNDLVQQAALPSTGSTSTSNYFNILLGQQYRFSPNWQGAL